MATICSTVTLLGRSRFSRGIHPSRTLILGGPVFGEHVTVGARHDRLVVLDDDDRGASVDEPVEQAQRSGKPGRPAA